MVAAGKSGDARYTALSVLALSSRFDGHAIQCPARG